VSTTTEQPRSRSEQVAHLRAEVDSLRDQLNHAHRLATVGTMTAMIAHEFNNILTPIINYARMAQSNPSLVGKALAHAADGGRRASEICNALLGLTVKGDQEIRTVRLAELIDKTLDAMARNPAKDGIDFKTNVPADLTISTRPVEFQQVLANLLINARTAVLRTTGPRRIEVSARTDGGQIAVTVADTGIGIAPEDQADIFEPFYSTTPAGVGSGQGRGLGLAFCRKIIEELGGRITVQSAPGRGSAFTIHLPA